LPESEQISPLPIVNTCTSLAERFSMLDGNGNAHITDEQATAPSEIALSILCLQSPRLNTMIDAALETADISTAADGTVETVPVQNGATSTPPTLTDTERAELVCAVGSFRLHLCNGKEHLIGSGRALKVIKRLWEKTGKSFKQHVRLELSIAYTTAIDWMDEADAADEATQTETGTGPVPESQEYPDDYDQPDPVANAIAKERAKVAARKKHTQNASDLMIFRPRFEFRSRERYDAATARYKQLSPEQATELFCHAMGVNDEANTD
jgi:hypothetical protein